MIGIWAGLVLLFAAAGGWSVVVGVALAAIAAVGAASRSAAFVAPAILVVAAAVLGAARGEPRPDAVAPDWAVRAEAFRGTVVGDPVRGGRNQRFLLDVSEADLGGTWEPRRGVLCVAGGAEPAVGLGDRVWLAGDPEGIDDVAASFRPVMRSRGCGASVFAARLEIDAAGSGWRRATATARDRVSGALKSFAPGDAGALMSGLVTGDDAALSPATDDAFVDTGTTHITAVSGSNFAILLVAFLAAGRASGWRRRMPWLLLVVGAIWGYAAFVGFGPPATRAALVATGTVVAVRFGRRPEIVTLIVVAAAAMVAVTPSLVWSLSFQLSLAASLAIAGVAAPSLDLGAWRWLGAAVLATAVAQLATVPILLPISGAVAWTSLPANVAIAPLVALAFPLSAVAGLVGVAWPAAGAVVALPGRLASDAIIAVVAFAAAVGGRVPSGSFPAQALFGLSLLAFAGCFAVSRDGQRVWRRAPALWAGFSPSERALWTGAAVGALLATAAAIFV